ncbi:MAG: Phosphate regulon transcriptional regulatory protein PhoB (SphR) [uncultured Gemmatimonadaceae bacterium]|uniref:Phosphate regulon transcriptional regulatory protein PhoB (SphR) n=1 Tax=uncultured Gemmatimonadaceae bacterium TaxID=246130 RepID=A0A6J4K9I8_9BACT|nr:MAG: Phosphate regulon transcriptional regulatory protein PhoB (SphR) [uncultured Gemmatimonadaceae bacterium]
MTAMRVLIVDDEPLARQRLRHLLAEIPGTEVVGECGDGTDAARAIGDLAPDVVLLDVQMREMGGFALVDAIGAGRMPPVVFVTAHDQFALRAFDVSAVDYLLKPVQTPQLARALQRAAERRRATDPALRGSLRALLETVRTMLGETPAAPAPTSPASESSPVQPGIVSFSDAVVDLRAHTVHRNGAAVALSPRGYALLATLVTRPGEVITRSQLLREIWGYSSDVMSRTVDMHIMELRRKLEADPANPRHFQTVRKTGYRFTRG